MTCVLKIYPNYINLSLLNGIYLAKNTEQQNRLPSAYDPDLHQKSTLPHVISHKTHIRKSASIVNGRI